ncbi:YIP1 family protein [Roseobacter sinensis]|uniref:YIP1 family protein n=1 Tax=Roseobacter sinensis TaxID=2931391 RepID=A0ABT3BBB1_9RHOB|nr:YIP1 family protein [Roseobacter sp. WL0113]MCV3270858.1 YIP1 family protein [Roseobacter sp. WL0113]
MIPATVNWPQLALLTLRDPKSAAAEIMSWQIPRAVLWMAAALVAIVSTFMSTLSNIVIPVPEPLANMVSSPFTLFMIIAGGFIITVHALFWTGRAIGGAEDMSDLLALLVWMQTLRAAAQVAIVIAVLMVPPLASLLVLFVAVATLWVFLNFISVGLHLNSLMRAFFVLIAGALAMSVGLSIVLSMIGVGSLGVPSNV